MQAKLKSLELKKVLKNYYIKVKVECQGKEYVLSNPLHSDVINFRKQVFGILTACNCYDLMRLARKEPIPRGAKGYYVQGRGYKIFENNYGQWLSFDKKLGIYSCKKADENIKTLIKYSQELNYSNVDVNDGVITSIVSQSGVFQMMFESQNNIISFFSTGQVYYGFGYPINIGNNASESEKIKSAKMFTSFITSIMQFYGEGDLLKLGGEIEDYPNVEITLDERNRIKSITNSETKLGLIVGKSYEIGMAELQLEASARNEEKDALKERLAFDTSKVEKTDELWNETVPIIREERETTK